ncbi:MAG: ATP synthase F1 subunit epsilon [Clostridia bacterium]|nr:ATP synthase F1 subunit epsilon [Clostridia bacterium]
MAETFHLQIVTPDKPVFDGTAEKLIVRTITGDVCILARHIDYAAALGIGEARVTDGEGNTRIAACNGGLLSVCDNQVRVMATTFEWADEIDTERARLSLDASQEALNKADRSDANYAALEAKLKRALVRVQISE